MKGTWQATGGGSSLPVGAILGGAVIAGVAYGIAEAVAAVTEDLVIAIFIIIAVVIAAVFAGAVWATVYRLRRGELPWARLQRRFLPEPVLRELPGAERPAIGQQGPRELHQHQHWHFHGVDAELLRAAENAEIIRRQAEQ